MACSYMYSHTRNDSSALEIQSAHTASRYIQRAVVGMFTQMQEADLLISCGMIQIRKLLVIPQSICHWHFD